jgi:tetratricopeptide (TPR) repeat protein
MKPYVFLAVALAALWPASSQAADEPTSNAWLRQGAELFKKQDYEGARAAFARAYELEPKAATLFNLALSELNADHPVEAVQHLREYLTHAEEPAPKLESVRTKWLPRAEARTARLDVFAPAGAQVAVDGVVQPGLAPEAGTASRTGLPLMSIVTSAGEHDVTARQGTATETQHVAARGGELVELHFQRVPDAAPPPVAMVWSNTANGPESREGTPATSSRAKWITVIALGSGAVVAAGLGVGFAVASTQKASAVQNLRGSLDAPSSHGWTGMECAGASASRVACTELRDDVTANRRDWTVSTVAFVGAAVLGVASLATWRWWRADTPKAAASLEVRPTIEARSASLAVDGEW